MQRILILATIAVFGLGLLGSPAIAEEAQEGSSKTTIEKAQKTVVPLPNFTHRGRLSTRDRWRGAPYLRSTADENLRSRAMDVALPSANPAFQGGLNLQQPKVFSIEDAARSQALDKALPPANPAFVGGGTFACEDAVRAEALNKALPPANSAFVGGSTGGGFGF